MLIALLSVIAVCGAGGLALGCLAFLRGRSAVPVPVIDIDSELIANAVRRGIAPLLALPPSVAPPIVIPGSDNAAVVEMLARIEGAQRATIASFAGYAEAALSAPSQVTLDPAPIAAALAAAVAAAMRDAFAAEGLREIGQPTAPTLAVESAVAALPRTSSMLLRSIVYNAVIAQLNFEAEHVPAQNVRLQTAAPPLNGTARPVGHYDFDQRVESICIRAQALSHTPLDPVELRAEVIREIRPLPLNTEIADDRRYARRTTLEAVK